MNNLSLILILIFSFLKPLKSMGQDEGPINSFSQGSCWYQVGKNGVRFASFNEKKSFQITSHHMDLISSEIERVIQKYDLTVKDRDVEVYLHCGGSGHAVVFNFIGESQNLCAWSQIYSDDQIRLAHVGYLPGNKKGFCDGMKPGVLIVGLKPGFDEKSDISLFKEGIFQEYVKEVRIINKTTVALTLYDEFAFNQDKIISYFKENLPEDVKYIEADYYYHPVGEYRRLAVEGER